MKYPKLLLIGTLLVAQLGACTSHNEGIPEESLQATDDGMAAEAPQPSAEVTEEQAALAEASNPDFIDPKEVQLDPTASSGDPLANSLTESTPSINTIEDSGEGLATIENAAGSPAASVAASAVYFGKNSTRLSKQARTELKNLAAQLKADHQSKIVVSGHCDTRGSKAYNKQLALKRAKAVKAYLVKLGAKSKQIATVSFGKDSIAVVAHSESEHAQNRRVEIQQK